MTEAEREEQETGVSQCFARGTVGEDCDDCFCHPSNDGICCYGEEHSYTDSHCRSCEYENKCKKLTHGVTSRSRSTRRVSASSNVGRSKMRKRRLQRKTDSTEPLIQLPSRNRTLEETDSEAPVHVDYQEPFMTRLGRLVGWGMIEGGLQMALSFFQRNRPE